MARMAKALAMVLAAAAVLPGAPARAHHSAAAYDLSRVTTEEGTLTELRFENPHLHFLLDVTGKDGAVTHWNIEGAPPHWFRRAGIAKSDFQKGVGKTVKIEMHPARDGSPTGFFQMITFADGTFIRFSDVVTQ